MFPKGNLNRIWLVLGAINELDKPTLSNISQAIDMPKPSVNDIIKKLLSGQVAGVTLEKVNTEYHIVHWLDFKKEVKKIYKKQLK